MITAIIIDDEAKGRLALREKLAAYCPDVCLLAEAADGPEALLQIEKHRPQLIFLDIEMPRMNGFDMLSRIPEKDFRIIFTTAYDQYAIKAIKYAAFDYLLKPVDIEELRAAVSKVYESRLAETKKQVELLQQAIHQPGLQWNKLAIPTFEGLLFYDVAQIVHLEAASNYTHIHLLDGTKVTASKTLKEFEDVLPARLFFRTHHSYLINLSYIRRYLKGDGGQVEMQNGRCIDVARRKKEEFLKAINGLSAPGS